LAVLLAACAEPTAPAPSIEIATISVGVPESKAQGASVGVSEFARALSLESLVRIGNDGHAVPWLAQGWTWEENQMRLRIQLRPNVFLHDGTPLKAELAASLLKAGVEDDENRALYPALNDIASVSAEGELDVVLALSKPSPVLPEDLGMPLRTGPFRIRSSKPEEVVLERFDRYYLGKPTVGEVIIAPFDTLRTAWAGLLRGELDVVSDVPADAVELIRNDDVQVIPYARRYQYLIAFNSRFGALRSAAVRRALNLAVDRQALLERVLQGRGTPSTGPLWPQYWAYDSSMQPYAFDPEQASAVLDAAGFPLPRRAKAGELPVRFRFTCLVPENFSVYVQIALEVQRNLLNIGVDMEVQAVSSEEFGKRIVSGNFDAILNDMISGPTPARAYLFWRSRHTYKTDYNVFGYENPEAERLFTVLNTTSNDAAVRSATGRLQQVMLNDPPALFLAWNARARAIRRDFVIPDSGGDPLFSLWRWTSGGAAAQQSVSR
jgi:peptide/nickel transport system substrate-binding protein